MTISEDEFSKLLMTCTEVAGFFPEGLVFIGGIAVYLYAINDQRTETFAEMTHDGDFYISLTDLSDLRDVEELTSNRRLSKHQFIKGGFEFDVYSQYESGLIVEYDQVVAYSETRDAVRIAALEHLLVLKLEAFRDRGKSSKGEKDARDLLRIAAVSEFGQHPFRAELCAPWLNETHLQLLQKVVSTPAYAFTMARGNSSVAKSLRAPLARIADAISDAMADPLPADAPKG